MPLSQLNLILLIDVVLLIVGVVLLGLSADESPFEARAVEAVDYLLALLQPNG